MNSDRPGYTSIFRENESGSPEMGRTVKLVCPFCYTVNEYNSAEHGISPKCKKCSRPLTGQRNGNGNVMKCLDCMLGMETPEGIWCLKFKGHVNEAMAKKCKEFLRKNTVHSEESDRYDG